MEDEYEHGILNDSLEALMADYFGMIHLIND